VDPNSYPVLYNIVSSYEDFYSAFCSKNGNIYKSLVFDNSCFRDTVSGDVVNAFFFGREIYTASCNIIRKLTFQDCFVNNNFKTLQEFRTDGILLNYAVWLRLRGTIMQAKNFFLSGNSKKCETIPEILRSWKKGCKRFRQYLDTIADPLRTNSFLKFQELVDTRPPTTGVWKNFWFSLWNTHSFNNDFRQFIFYNRYNYLPTNNRLNSYYKDVDPRCTYCKIIDSDSNMRDSYAHCFLACPTSVRFINVINSKLGIRLEVDSDGFKRLFWFGIPPQNNSFKDDLNNTLGFQMVYDIFRYIFFKNRKRCRIPTEEEFLAVYKFFFVNLYNANKKLANILNQVLLLRNFLQARG
jgi:hypothetical protein